jgi:hypothetical protein
VLSPEKNYAYQMKPEPPKQGEEKKDPVTLLFWKKIMKSIDRLPDELRLPPSPYVRRLTEIREVAERYYEQHKKEVADRQSEQRGL